MSNNISERFEACLTFLEKIRSGYKYSITIHKPYIEDGDWTIVASVVGECYNDKSYPHTFISVKVHDFDKLPEAIQLESQKIIDAEIESKKKSIENLNKDIEKLLFKGALLVELKSKLTT